MRIRWEQREVKVDSLEPRLMLAFGAAVDYVVRNQWSTGLTADVTIRNTGTTSISHWSLLFDFAGSISDFWSAAITSPAAGHYVAANVDYNSTIAPGTSQTFGFNANFTTVPAAPTNYKLNGTAITGGTLPVLSVAGGSVNEGNSGATPLLFTVSLSAAPTSAVSVQYATTPGTAISVTDFTANSGPLNFAAGETSKTISVLVNGDTTAEADETFTLTLSNASGATIGTSSATGTIINDDGVVVPKISVGSTSVTPTPQPPGTGFLHASGNQIVDAAGNSVRITGINWFGFETSNKALHGLWTRGYKSSLDQIKQLGFNTVRLPFSNEMLRPGATTSGINFAANPDLLGLSPLQVLDKVIDYCGQAGLRVILDRHSSKADGYLNESLWYISGDATYTEQLWIDDWKMLAGRYAGNPTVIGADLWNEPKQTSTWGSGNLATDWNIAAERCGSAVLGVNPDWLIFIEGVEKYANATYWWGGNLKGVASAPVTLSVPNHVVYSAHDYPSSVFAQSWFSDPNYPANLGSVWDSYWGYIYKQNIAPVWVGEFGTKLATVSDQQWLDMLTDYLDGDFDLNGTNDLAAGKKGINFTYWCWNPNSGDTGGILNDDWTTVNTAKMAYLQASLAPALGGAGATPYASFTVSLDQVATVPVTVHYATQNGTALAGTNYTAMSGDLTFAAGETSKIINVPVSYVAGQTANLSFNLVLSSPTNATVTSGTGAGTIEPSGFHVSSMTFDPSGAGQKVRVRFSAAATVNVNHLQFTNLTTGQVVATTSLAVVFDSASNTATVSFPGFASGVLPDGDWRLTVSTSVTDSVGNALIAPASLDFFVLNADANRDRTVNFFDLTPLAANYGASGMGWADGDFNGDGMVNFFDLTALAANYSVTLPAPSESVADAPLAAVAEPVVPAASEPVSAVESSAPITAAIEEAPLDQSEAIAQPVAAPLVAPRLVSGSARRAHADTPKAAAASDPPRPGPVVKIRRVVPQPTTVVPAPLPPSLFAGKPRKRLPGNGIFSDTRVIAQEMK